MPKVTSPVDQVLRSPGQPLDTAVRAQMEPRFARDFSRVRVHTDAQAAASAEAIDADAYTSGSHVVFGPDRYRPESLSGRKLLAHELTHVIQQAGISSKELLPPDVSARCDQEAERAARSMVAPNAAGDTGVRVKPVPTHRFGVDEALRFPGRPLDTATRGRMEPRFGHDFSRVRIHTDAQAASSAEALNAAAYTLGQHVVFGRGQYRPDSESGQRLLAHELTHVLQQQLIAPPVTRKLTVGPANDAFEAQANKQSHEMARLDPFPSAARMVQRAPNDAALKRETCETTANPPDAKPLECLYKFPENCPTYERWIETFGTLKTFEARATPVTETVGGHIKGPNVFNVLGGGASLRQPKKGEEAQAAPPPTGALRTGEAFIDHATDEWVKNCLPANLRATAYQLPSDCADIAVILRHVWLAAHRRTEKFGKWTIGDAAGRSAAAQMAGVISEVYTGNVAQMVNPYTDERGQPLLSFADLEPLLHPGDVLVWVHHDNGFDKPRTGGHTLTVVRVNRSPSGKILSLLALQGNEPIFGDSEDSEEADDKAKIIKALKLKDTKAVRDALGRAPGRRIETNTLLTSDFTDSNPETDKTKQKTWKWNENTILVAAGPPKAARRPAMKKERGKTVRRISDWFLPLKAASDSALPGVFEAALLEARAIIERGEVVSGDDMRALGKRAGERVWALAKVAGGLADETHFRRLAQMRAVIQAYRTGNALRVGRLFDLSDEAFNVAARGGTDIKFGAAPQKGELVSVLVTGFDPFDPGGSLRPPERGSWNPSGAAALALDGKRIQVPVAKGLSAVASVQGVVLPVSYDEFKTDLVERIVKPFATSVDAVITASVDPNLPSGAPVRLERYAVGVHSVGGGAAIPAAAGGDLGPAIIEAPAPLEQISSATTDPKAKVTTPTIGEDITLDFATASVASDARETLAKMSTDRAVTLLKIQQVGAVLTITDRTVIGAVASTMTRDVDGRRIAFTVQGQTFRAAVLRGPGGDFLSNEVSFRVLRLLAEAKGANAPISFHVHTEQGNAATPRNKAAKTTASGVLTKLITTLRRLIAAVTTVIVDRRKKTSTGEAP
jgi:acyl dehydratase